MSARIFTREGQSHQRCIRIGTARFVCRENRELIERLREIRSRAPDNVRAAP